MRTGILIFDNVEELDFVGPWEILSSVNTLASGSLEMLLVGTGTPVRAFNRMRVLPDLLLGECPQLDLLVIPGGEGRKKQMHDERTLQFILGQYPNLKYLSSVCTGSLILAEAGLLDGKVATTHHSALQELRSYPHVRVEPERLTRSGNIICAAGVTSGIDLALYLVSEICGEGMATEVAARVEYPWSPAHPGSSSWLQR